MPFVNRSHYELIKSQLDRGLADVYVHWGVQHAGKFIAAKAVTNAIWNDGPGVSFIDGARSVVKCDMTQEECFRLALRIPSLNEDGNIPLSEYLLSEPAIPIDLEIQMSPRYTIILDHVDCVMKLKVVPSFRAS